MRASARHTSPRTRMAYPFITRTNCSVTMLTGSGTSLGSWWTTVIWDVFRVRSRIVDSLSTLFCGTCGDQRISGIWRVQRLNVPAPLLLDDLSPYFQRRRQLARLDGELARQQADLLDPLELRQLEIERVDHLRIKRDHIGALDQRFAFCRRPPEVGQPPFQGGEVRYDQRGGEAASVAEDHRFRDERAAPQHGLDRLRRDLLAT